MPPTESSTPEYSELVSAIRREGEGILSAAGLGLDAWVPTCKEWNVEALVEHVSKVYANAAYLVSHRATEPPAERPPVPDGDPVQVLTDLLDELVAALSDAEPDTQAWNWTPTEPHVAGFWARRMAHESSIHRFDAQIAHGIAQPIDAELAADGLDELVDLIAPRVYDRDGVDDAPTGTVHLESSDNGSWFVELQPASLVRVEIVSEPDVTVRGTTSGLLLAVNSRIPWNTQEVEGDDGLLKAWSKSMNF